jgi:hypothetical protein
MAEGKSKVPGKKKIAGGIYSTQKEGYSQDESTGQTVLPTTESRGLESVQRGAQTEFKVTEVSKSGNLKEDESVTVKIEKDAYGNRSAKEIGGGIPVDEMLPPTEGQEPNPVLGDSGTFDLQNDLAEPNPQGAASGFSQAGFAPVQERAMTKQEAMTQWNLVENEAPQSPKVKMGLKCDVIELALKWHSCIIEPSRQDGGGYVVVLVHDLGYDPDFDIKLPIGLEYDLTISVDNGSITHCKRAYYGGQTFTYKDSIFYVLFSPEVTNDGQTR